jgi:hypothetical protein
MGVPYIRSLLAVADNGVPTRRLGIFGTQMTCQAPAQSGVTGSLNISPFGVVISTHSLGLDMCWMYYKKCLDKSVGMNRKKSV